MRYPSFALAALLFAAPALAAEPVTPVAPPAAPAPAAAGAAAPAGVAPAEAPAEAAPPSWVYMVVRVKLADNDITQVAFLRHPAITTLEACEQERAAGMMQGWRYYNRYYFKTLKGISYKIDFRCVEGQQYMAYWRAGDLLNHYHLVRTTEGKLDARPYETFFACRRALHKVTAGESIDAFCGVGSQAITQPPVEPPEPEETPAAATTPPAAGLPATPAPAPSLPPAPAVPAR